MRSIFSDVYRFKEIHIYPIPWYVDNFGVICATMCVSYVP